MTQAGLNVDSGPPTLRRVLRLRDLIFYGIIIIQPTAPMPIFGVPAKIVGSLWPALGLVYAAVRGILRRPVRNHE
jgi:hypothetical protein